ncbi:MAG: type 1 glutamine amidotransferase domain-containing protein [Thermodesulfobacteriota bacterium]
MQALIVSGDQFEDSELLVPWYRLLEEGIETNIGGEREGVITGKHGYQVEVNLAIERIDPTRYDLLILPGGKAPALLRKNSKLLELVRHFFNAGKLVAAICHGPQILVSAGVVAGRNMTCYKGMAHELQGVGANYLDQPVVVDYNLITSRVPSDLPDFLRAIMKYLFHEV